MSRQHALEASASDTQQALRDRDVADPALDLRGPWFSPAQAARYIPCKTVKAFYEWKRRKGLIARNNGSVAKADIDRILRKRRVRRVMAAASLANLRKRSA